MHMLLVAEEHALKLLKYVSIACHTLHWLEHCYAADDRLSHPIL